MSNIKNSISLLPLGLFLVGCWPEASASQPWTAELEEYIAVSANSARFPATAISVVSADEMLYSSVYVRDGFSLDVDPDTAFYIGSVSKSLTALAVVAAAEDGWIDLDNPVAAHVRELGGFDDNPLKQVTVRHLLNQTSGFSEIMGHDRRAHNGSYEHLELSREPGAAYEYSSLNYVLLGEVIKRATAGTYSDWAEERIIGPLGMVSTIADNMDHDGIRKVKGFTYAFGANLPWSQSEVGEAAIPMGYVQSSLNDLSRYLQLYLNRGKVGDLQLISEDSLVLMHTTPTSVESNYGMGWYATTWHGQEAYYHAGMTSTSGAFLLLLPESGLGFVILTNINSGALVPGTLGILRGAVDIVLGNNAEPYKPTEFWIHVAIGTGLAIGLILLVVRMMRWFRSKRPTMICTEGRALAALAVDLAFPVVVIVVISLWAGITPVAMLGVLPDLGAALLLSVPVGWGNGILKSVLRRERAVNDQRVRTSGARKRVWLRSLRGRNRDLR